MKTQRKTLKRPSSKLRYRVETAASALGVSPRSLRYGIHVGLISVVRDGAGIFILADELRKVSSTDHFLALGRKRKNAREQ